VSYTAPSDIYSLSLHDALPIYSIVLSPFATIVSVDLVNQIHDQGYITYVYQYVIRSESGQERSYTHNVSERTLQIVNYYKNNNRSEEHTSELQSRENLVCRLLL